MSGRPAVRLATAAEIPELAAVLARAFARDPFYAYLAGRSPERNQRMRDGWTGLLRHASDRLSATYTTDDRAGVALWHPPGYRGAGFVTSLRLLPSMARLAGSLRRLREVSRAVATLEERRRHHAPGPHFYLAALGVEPDRQGEGIGTALMQPALAMADAGSVPAYLETATGRNVLLYERAGFAVVEELTLPATDVHGWLMLRRPAASAVRP
jgi:ribosomal protein S18 acetylase RimI-like enzyme